MEVPETVEFKLLSTPDVIQELETEASRHPEQVNIVSSGPEEDPTSLEFGLETALMLIGVAQGAFWIGELALMIHRWLKERNRAISVQTPFGRWVFVPRSDLTVEEVREVLRRLSDVPV